MVHKSRLRWLPLTTTISQYQGLLFGAFGSGFFPDPDQWKKRLKTKYSISRKFYFVYWWNHGTKFLVRKKLKKPRSIRIQNTGLQREILVGFSKQLFRNWTSLCACAWKTSIETKLWIRIHFLQIRIQQFFWMWIREVEWMPIHADPDPASQIFLIHKLMQSFFKL